MNWKPTKIKGVVFHIVDIYGNDLGNYEFPSNSYLSVNDEIILPDHSNMHVNKIECIQGYRRVIIGPKYERT